jgi:hypothetical protein
MPLEGVFRLILNGNIAKGLIRQKQEEEEEKEKRSYMTVTHGSTISCRRLLALSILISLPFMIW